MHVIALVSDALTIPKCVLTHALRIKFVFPLRCIVQCVIRCCLYMTDALYVLQAVYPIKHLDVMPIARTLAASCAWLHAD